MKRARQGASRLALKVAKEVAKHIFLIVMALVSIYPVIWVVSTAFTPGQSLATGWHLVLGILPIPNKPTLSQFQFIFNPKLIPFTLWAKNSLIITLSTVAGSLAVVLPAGYALSRRAFPGRSSMMFSFLLPTMFPGVVTIIPLFLIYANLHLVNTYLGLVIAYTVGSLSLSIFIMKNAFDGVPKDLDEAAKIDGAGDVRVFWQILLPLTLPSIATVALWAFMGAWLDFALAHVMLENNNLWTLALALYSFITPTSVEYGTFSAISIIMAIPVFIVFMLFQKYLVSGLTAGSVKG
jgi:arabinogalactan oligomer / maltooligosaccharide transport system permease protein